jgi:hypothetical protein
MRKVTHQKLNLISSWQLILFGYSTAASTRISARALAQSIGSSFVSNIQGFDVIKVENSTQVADLNTLLLIEFRTGRYFEITRKCTAVLAVFRYLVHFLGIGTSIFTAGFKYLNPAVNDETTGLDTHEMQDQCSAFSRDLSLFCRSKTDLNVLHALADIINATNSKYVVRLKADMQLFCFGHLCWAKVGYKFQ